MRNYNSIHVSQYFPDHIFPQFCTLLCIKGGERRGGVYSISLDCRPRMKWDFLKIVSVEVQQWSCNYHRKSPGISYKRTAARYVTSTVSDNMRQAEWFQFVATSSEGNGTPWLGNNFVCQAKIVLQTSILAYRWQYALYYACVVEVL